MPKFLEEAETSAIRIKVVGVGNAGGNIVTRISESIEDVDFIVFNTDGQALRYCKADYKIQIGERTTLGRGTGRDPEKGKFAANEDKDKIADVLKGANIVFLSAGLGGGTGTGSSPVVAKIAKDGGAIVIALVTTPFNFEGQRKAEQAKSGLETLERNVDMLIHIPNEKLAQSVDAQVSMLEAFKKVDEIISRTISSIADLINKPKVLLDIDFADICSIVEKAGRGLVGLGHGKGEDRMKNAAKDAIEDPLFEKSDAMEASHILISITGSTNLSLKEVEEAMDIIQTRISSGSRELGVTIDDKLDDEVKITLIATGIGGRPRGEVRKTQPQQQSGSGEVSLPLTQNARQDPKAGARTDPDLPPGVLVNRNILFKSTAGEE